MPWAISIREPTAGKEIAHPQAFNRILSVAEMDAAALTPGSVRNGLKLWLPMTNVDDVYDRSGNGNDGTATDLDPGGSGPPITRELTLPPGFVRVPAGTTTVTQHVIARFADGVTYPGAQLRGYGPASVIRGNSSTSALPTTPIDQRSVVMTEDFGYGIAQWQSDTETTRKAVLQATVRDLTIAGHDETGTGYSAGGLVNNNPNLWNKIKGKITNATTTSPIRITSPFYSLPTGATLTISGLDSLNNDGVDGSRTVTRLTGTITSTSGGNPVVVTAPGHNLTDQTSVLISNVTGNEIANGIHVITYIDANSFSIPVDGMGTGSMGGNWDSLDIFSINVNYTTGSYTPGTGSWKSTYWGDKYHGLLMRSSGLLVQNVNFFYFPGTALVVKKGGAGGQTGPKLMFDREKARIWDCKVNRAYSGFWIDDIDSVVGRLEGSDLRDYGIKFGRTIEEGGGGGSTQIDGALHFYGVGQGGTDEPAVWFPDGAGGCWGGPIYAENAPVGVLVESSNNQLGPIHSHSCSLANLRIKNADYNRFSHFDIRANVLGALLENAQYTSLVNGTFAVETNATGIRLASGNAGVRLFVDGVVFNAFGKSNTVAIDADVTLNDTTIIATFLGGDETGTGNVGIDLVDGMTSRIGFNNYIRITTRNWDESDTDIDLPAMWDSSNTIIVNGTAKTP
jgi:hypothetical protein